jgi:hypothetical protein
MTIPTVSATSKLAEALDQLTPFVGRAVNDSFCQYLPLARRETVWKQCALISVVPKSADSAAARIRRQKSLFRRLDRKFYPSR